MLLIYFCFVVYFYFNQIVSVEIHQTESDIDNCFIDDILKKPKEISKSASSKPCSTNDMQKLDYLSKPGSSITAVGITSVSVHGIPVISIIYIYISFKLCDNVCFIFFRSKRRVVRTFH